MEKLLANSRALPVNFGILKSYISTEEIRAQCQSRQSLNGHKHLKIDAFLRMVINMAGYQMSYVLRAMCLSWADPDANYYVVSIE